MKMLVMSVSVCSVLLAASAAVPVFATATEKFAKVNSTQNSSDTAFAINAAKYGYAALVGGRNDTAIRQYTRAISSNKLPEKTLVRAFLNRALAHQNQGLYKSAIKDYSAAMKRKSLSRKMRSVALYNRGLANAKSRNPANAIKDFTNALIIDPKFSQAYYSRGNVLREHGQYLFAMSDYKKARQLKHPSIHLTYLGEALTYASLNQVTRAKALLLQAVAIKPGFKAARQKLASLSKSVPLPKSTPANKRIQIVSIDPTLIPTTLVTGSLRKGQADLVIRKTSLPKPVSVPKTMKKAVKTAVLPPLPEVPALPNQAQKPKLPAPVSVAALTKKAPAIAPKTVKPTMVKAKVTAHDTVLQGWTVQISSQRNSQAAWDVWSNLTAKHAGILKDQSAAVAKADLGTRGIFYRLRIHKLNNKKSAAKLCGQLKRKGTSCFVSKS